MFALFFGPVCQSGLVLFVKKAPTGSCFAIRSGANRAYRLSLKESVSFFYFLCFSWFASTFVSNCCHICQSVLLKTIAALTAGLCLLWVFMLVIIGKVCFRHLWSIFFAVVLGWTIQLQDRLFNMTARPVLGETVWSCHYSYIFLNFKARARRVVFV